MYSDAPKATPHCGLSCPRWVRCNINIDCRPVLIDGYMQPIQAGQSRCLDSSVPACRQ